ncbi:MAG TPA: hypothetical protein VGF58_00660 [Burkholderiales bacterium]
MTELSVQRQLALLILAVIALLVPYPLLQDALRVTNSSESQLIAGFYDMAFEDVFGFGYWFSWAIFAFLEAAAIAGGWLVARRHLLRYSLLLPLAVFTAVTLYSYDSYMLEYSLWLKAG